MNNKSSSQYFLDNLTLPNNENQLIEFVNNQIGIYLTYCGLYGTDYGYQDFLKKQNLNNFSQHTNSFYPKSIEALAKDFIEKTNINLNTLTENNTDFESVLYKIYCAYHKHCFHGCAFIDNSILENGLDVSKKHPLNQEYLELATKYNLFESVINFDYSKIYYSFTAQPSAKFAYSSPSWIGFLISDSRAYELKNYDEALAKLQTYINSCNLNAEDSKNIVEFFNKSWHTYKNSQPVILEINNPTPALSLDEFKSHYHKFIPPTQSIEQDVVKFFYYLYVMNIFNVKNNNFKNDTIPKSDIVKIHYLPHINLLKEKMKKNQKEK